MAAPEPPPSAPATSTGNQGLVGAFGALIILASFFVPFFTIMSMDDYTIGFDDAYNTVDRLQAAMFGVIGAGTGGIILALQAVVNRLER